MSFFVENIYSVILIPFWAMLIILLGKLFAVISSKKVVNAVTLISTLYCLVFSLGVFIKTLVEKGYSYELNIPFITVSKFSFPVGFYIDGVSSWFLLLAVLVSLLVQIYSMSYMKNDNSYVRFFAYLNLFNFSMFGLILSPNLFQIYIFWELVGVSSYLLIGFWYKKQDVSVAAKKAFIINRVGDFCFLSGIILSAYIILFNLGNFTSVAIPFSEMQSISAQIYGCTSDGIYIVTCILLLMGSIAKSAQFPLHTWLIDAMKGPTPVSALIHSATMVAAGVFLLIRLYPLYSLSNIILHIISVVGIITAIMCSYSAITQTDIKKILAYSTNAQLGLMFLAVGSCSVTVSLLHLTAHAFAKAMLFLIAGVVVFCANNQDIRFISGLRKKYPLCAYAFLIGVFSLSGLLFSGFTTKEMILSELIKSNHIVYAILFNIVAAMTVYYLFRLYFNIFEGTSNDELSLNKPDNTMMYIPIVFSLFVICLWFVFPKFGNILFATVNIGIASLAASLAYITFRHRQLIKRVPILYNISFDAFYAEDIISAIVRLYKMIVRILDFIERYIFNGISYVSVFFTRVFSILFSKMQTGNIQSYMTYSVFIIMMYFSSILLVYVIILYISGVQ